MGKVVADSVVMVFDPTKKKPEWGDFKKMISDASFIKRCKTFDASKFSREKAAEIRKYLQKNELDQWEHNKRLKAVSLAMSALHRWVLGLLDEVNKNK